MGKISEGTMEEIRVRLVLGVMGSRTVELLPVIKIPPSVPTKREESAKIQ
jgi:hypothetical protein